MDEELNAPVTPLKCLCGSDVGRITRADHGEGS